MIKKSIKIILFFAILLGGQYSLYAQNFINDSILIEGKYRYFYFKKPTKKVTPNLVFVLHFSGAKPTDMIQPAAKLQARANAENLIIVYPIAYKNYWNDCRKASNAVANIENINETAFFEAMIRYFKKNYGTDTKKIYAIGFSGGGHLAYKLALVLPTKLAGISAVVASMPTIANNDCLPTSAPPRPLRVLVANGTADAVSPYNGGAINAQNIILGNVLPTIETIDFWIKANNLPIKPTEKTLPDANNDGVFIKTYTYQQKNKPTVKLLKVVGGKHEFTTDVDIFEYSWNFFKENK